MNQRFESGLETAAGREIRLSGPSGASKLNVMADVGWTQIAVYSASEENPGSMWSDSHVRQGFVWRAVGVQFATFQCALHEIEVRVSEEWTSDPLAARIIEVPFDVGDAENRVEISTMTDNFYCEVPSGGYRLRYELFVPASSEFARLRLTFTPNIGPGSFAILRADEQISGTRELDLTAEPL